MIPIDSMKVYLPELVKGKVIAITNEDQPITVGHIVGFEELGQDAKRIPLVQDEHGKNWITFGIILPYDKKLLQYLSSLKHDERFQILSKILWLYTELHRLERSPEIYETD